MDYIGKLCAKHPELLGERNKNGNCKQCNRDSARDSRERDKDTDAYKQRQKDWLANNKERRKAYARKYYSAHRAESLERLNKWSADNPERRKQSRQAWHLANQDTVNERSREWRQANPDRSRAQAAAWAKANAGRVNAGTARYRASKLQATPAWADEFILSEAYELAQLRQKATGIDWHVDHIVPLRSKLVCGLHCEFNLQVIPGTDNRIKNNVRWPDMPR